MPSLNIMNGFRFGKATWEFVFGPGFGVSKVSTGFFYTKGLIGDQGDYVSASDWAEYAHRNLKDPVANPNQYVNGVFTPDPSKLDSEYNLDTEHGDTRGATKLSTSFIFAFGRTFRAGALNIPINVFYSSKKGGGFAGLSVGFNVMKSKKPINPKRI